MECRIHIKSEARGDAREAIGNTAPGTDANPTGPEGNDNQRGRDDREEFPRSRPNVFV